MAHPVQKAFGSSCHQRRVACEQHMRSVGPGHRNIEFFRASSSLSPQQRARKQSICLSCMDTKASASSDPCSIAARCTDPCRTDMDRSVHKQ
eukprot:2220552-Rhodomonas_salina.1